MYYLSSLNEPIQAAIIGGGATLAAAVVGFGAIAWQIWSQGNQSREAVKKAERQKLHSAAYDKAAETCAELSEAASGFQVLLLRMGQDVFLAAKMAEKGADYPLPAARSPALLDSQKRLADAIYDFMVHVENWRIIDPRLIVFRTAMNAAAYEIREPFMRTFASHLMHALPVEGPNGQLAHYDPPSVAQARVIMIILDSIGDAVADVIAYKEDYLVELQNVLLGDIFDHTVSHRTPADPRRKVIRVDEAEALEEWFLNHTAWGQFIRDEESKAASKFQTVYSAAGT